MSPKNMNQTVIIVIMNVLCHRFLIWCWYFKDTLCKFTPSKHNGEFWTDWNRVTLHQISLIHCAANYTILGYELKKKYVNTIIRVSFSLDWQIWMKNPLAMSKRYQLWLSGTFYVNVQLYLKYYRTSLMAIMRNE